MIQVNKKKLARNFFSLSLVQGINALLQLLVVPFVIAKIGVENFGRVAVAQVIMFFLGTLAEYGFGQTGSREVSLNKEDRNKLSELFFTCIHTKLILCVAAFLILLLLAAVFPVIREHFMLYCMAFVFVPGQASLPSWFLQGMEKLHWAALSVLCSKIIFVVLIFLFIRKPDDAALFTFFLGTGNLIAGIAASVFVVRMFGLHYSRPSLNRIISSLQDGWSVTATNLSMNFMQYGNLFILRLYTNDLAAGYFSVAERVYFAMKQVLTAFAQTIYPNVCRLATQGGTTLKQYFKKIFIPFLLLTTIASAAVIILAPLIIGFFMHEQHDEAVLLLRLLCIAVPVVCLNMPGSLSLLALNKKKTYFLIYLSGLLLCITGNLVLASIYGARGTVVSIYLTELFITTGVSLALIKIFRSYAGNKQP
ncbi:MAG: oligosaccharide flippase family protein [Sphingobacteriales bacterium]|nr:oligosaccharide flippase family protein [Sphingobacteriales bacterium]